MTSKLSRQALKKIRAIPDREGWWKKSTRQTFVDVAEKMKEKGFHEGEIVEILEELYFAAIEENEE